MKEDYVRIKERIIELVEKEVRGGKMKIEDRKVIEEMRDLMKKSEGLGRLFELNYLCKDKHIEALIKNSSVIQVPENYCIFKQGSTVQELLCLISGKIAIKISKATLSINDTSIKSNLVNEYNLIKEPIINYNTSQSQPQNQSQNQPLLIMNNNNNHRRRSSVCRMFYEINLQNRLKRGSIYSNTPVIKSGIFGKTKKLSSPIPSALIDQDEIEQFTIEDQGFINNWNLINNFLHYSTAVSKGPCILLCLDIHNFHKVIQRPLSYAQNERKTFISSRIKTLSKLSPIQFDTLYHQFIFTYPKLNDIIIPEGTSSLSPGMFYLIYKGQCSIQPTNYHKNVLHCSSGDFINLEALFNSCKDNSSYTITSTSAKTILIKFDIKLFNALLIKEIKEELLEYYKQKKEIYGDITRRTASLRHKFKKSFKNLGNGSMCSVMQTEPQNQSDIIMKKTMTTVASTVGNEINTIDYNKINNVKTGFRIKKRLKKFHLKQKLLSNEETSHMNHLMTMSTTFRSNDHSEGKYTNTNTKTKTNNDRMINIKSNIIHRNPFKPSILKIPKEKNTNSRRVGSKQPTPRSTCPTNSTTISFNKTNLLTTNNNINHNHHPSPLISTLEMKFIEPLHKTKRLIYGCYNEKLNKTINNWTKTLHDSQKAFETETYRIPLISTTSQ